MSGSYPATGERVRLTADRRATQPDIGEAIGTVHGAASVDRQIVIEVQWPAFRSLHKAGDLEPAP